MTLYDKVVEAQKYIQKYIQQLPQIAMIAGTGLGDIGSHIQVQKKILYKDIPHFPEPSVEGHQGEMVFGKMGNHFVVILKGRFHYYEGYEMQEITFPVRVVKAIGIQQIIITNASGALQKNINAGDIVFIKDHINLFPDNPLRGINDPRLGLRFPSMDKVYDIHLLQKAQTIASDLNIPFHQGVYVGLQGPSLETKAEYEYLNKIGGDVVGMSTVPEVIVAAQCELQVLCISVCTNNPFKDGVATTIEEVVEVAKIAGEKIQKLIFKMLSI